jgi:hypothetical protein
MNEGALRARINSYSVNRFGAAMHVGDWVSYHRGCGEDDSVMPAAARPIGNQPMDVPPQSAFKKATRSAFCWAVKPMSKR